MCAVEHFRTRRDRRIPIERDRTRATPDAHFIPGLGAVLPERIFDAEFRESVREVSDGFVIVEIRLHDPTFRFRSAHGVPIVAVAVLFTFDRELLDARVARIAALRPLVLQRFDDDARFLRTRFARGDVLAHLGDKVREREVECFESFVRRRRHDVYRQIHLLELRFDEFREFLRFGHIDFVEDDDTRPFGDRNRSERKFEFVRIFREFLFERAVVGYRVAVRFERRAIDDVRDDFGAFDVAQELQSESFSLRRARDESGDVGDRVPHIARLYDAEVRHECRERIVGDFRFRRRHGRDERRFSCRREAYECDVCD